MIADTYFIYENTDSWDIRIQMYGESAVLNVLNMNYILLNI